MGINGTWLGGLVAHLILVPLWTLSPTFPMIAIGFLFCGGAWTALGAAMLLLVLFLNNKTFAYRPWVVHWLYDKDLTGYYRKCRLAGPHLDSLPKSKALYMFHPHGVLSVGFVVNGCWSRHFNALTTKQDVDVPKSTGTVFLIAKSLREWMSFFKVLCDFSGRLESATKDAIFKLMREGRNLAIIPGGFEDATIHKWRKHRTMLKSKKGLIKYALQHGYSCVPIYSFGEDETYYTFTPLLSFRLWLNKFNLPGVVFFGESWLPLLPKCSAEVLTYVGPPLQLPLIEQPTKEQVDEWHGKYIAALTTLFDTHKKEAGHEHAHLEIW